MEQPEQTLHNRTEKNRGASFQTLLVVAVIVCIFLAFHLISGGTFLQMDNLAIVISHTVYPTFMAWGLCFLFACGYTDMSIGGVVVLGSFATGVLGNMYGYPGAVLGGLAVGLILVFINFLIFAFSGIPSWIAGISLAMIYEAIAVAVKLNPTLKPLIETDMNQNIRLFGSFPWSLILLFIGLFIVYLIYNRTTIGLNIRAIGGNQQVSKALGISLIRTLLFVGLITGILIGVAAFIQESYAGQTTVKTGLTSMYMIFQPLAIVLLAQILQRWINIIIAVPICAFIIYSVFTLLTTMGVPSGTLQEASLCVFLIVFGIIGRFGYKGVVK
ncbi:MAG: hypothetical protein FWF33_02055 [Clostridiales bacterium]|nr:hypothetical protein [Clostridiales bacterium]